MRIFWRQYHQRSAYQARTRTTYVMIREYHTLLMSIPRYWVCRSLSCDSDWWIRYLILKTGIYRPDPHGAYLLRVGRIRIAICQIDYQQICAKFHISLMMIIAGHLCWYSSRSMVINTYVASFVSGTYCRIYDATLMRISASPISGPGY